MALFAEMLTALEASTPMTLVARSGEPQPLPRRRHPAVLDQRQFVDEQDRLFQYVCREYFWMEKDDAPREGGRRRPREVADRRRAAYWAMSDQIVNGVAQGSKYYPRCVTTVLWL